MFLLGSLDQRITKLKCMADGDGIREGGTGEVLAIEEAKETKIPGCKQKQRDNSPGTGENQPWITSVTVLVRKRNFGPKDPNCER